MKQQKSLARKHRLNTEKTFECLDLAIRRVAYVDRVVAHTVPSDDLDIQDPILHMFS